MGIWSAPRRRTVTGMVALLAVVAVAPASASARVPETAGGAKAAPACNGVTEATLNQWIRKANSGVEVRKEVTARPAGCQVTIGAAGLEPLSGRLALSTTGRIALHGGDSIFDVQARAVLSVDGFTLSGATASALSTTYSSRTTLSNCKLTANNSFFGGAIVNSGGAITINNCEITGNTAMGAGGGIANSGATSTLKVVDSKINGNKALYGGGIYNAAGTITLINTEVNENESQGAAAGFVNSSGTATLIDSDVSRNTLPPGSGGAFSNAGTLNVVNTTVTDNSGSGFFNGGILLVSGSRIAGNDAVGAGGAINNGGGGTATVANSEIVGNTATEGGGGVANVDGGSVELINAEVTGNTAGAPGGGLANLVGGMIIVEGGTVTGNTPDNCHETSGC